MLAPRHGVAVPPAAVVPVGVQGVLEDHLGRQTGVHDVMGATVAVPLVGDVLADVGSVVAHLGGGTDVGSGGATLVPLGSAKVHVVVGQHLLTGVGDLLAHLGSISHEYATVDEGNVGVVDLGLVLEEYAVEPLAVFSALAALHRVIVLLATLAQSGSIG